MGQLVKQTNKQVNNPQQCHQGRGEAEGTLLAVVERSGRTSWRKGYVKGDKKEKQELAAQGR